MRHEAECIWCGDTFVEDDSKPIGASAQEHMRTCPLRPQSGSNIAESTR